jgi:SAGA-associated factor 73
MAALARHRPRPLVTFTPVSLQAKYQHRRMKDMLRSCLGNPPGASMHPQNPDTMGAVRGLALSTGIMPGSATSENFPNSAGGMGGLASSMNTALEAQGSRRPSAINMGGAGGPRMIAPGQLPGPGLQRKGSMASVASVGAS